MDAEVPFLPTGVAGTGEPPLAGVSDFRGRPVYRSTSGGWRSALFVSVLEIATNFANFGVSSNLITYLTGPLGHSNAAAAAAVNAWSGTASLMPLLGAIVADSWLGRYRSIVLACILYILGYGMMTLVSTLPMLQLPLHSDNNFSSGPSSLKIVFVYASLYLIALAQGADKPCGLAFAADQFDPDHPSERAARSSLFNWFYFSMAIGIAVAVAGVSPIQENVGWGIGFGALCATIICAFIVFLVGTSTYRLYTPTSGSESLTIRLAHGLTGHAKKYLSFTFYTNRHQEDDDKANKLEEARAVLRLLPIWVTCLAFGVVFAQVSTLFNKQGRTLDLHIFGGLELPPSMLRAFGPVSILVFVPVYDRVLVPALRYTTGNPSGLTTLQRIGTGMALSLAAVSVAALVESRRLETAREHGLVDDVSGTVPMCWAWLVPQYVIVGMADVFAVVGMREFFYDQMPDDLRSLGLALFWGVMGVSSFISGALISLIDRVTKSGGGDSWFADNLNRAHLDYFYWLLAELVLYLHFVSTYVYIRRRLR